uniref:Protein transport protein Sec16B n=1 Tax=Cacopsylla melanoneura TaxID=428564 RepID=A0A8D8VFB0_9HEMI
MSSRHGKYEKHGYLIEEICQTYPELNQELEMRMLQFRAQFPTKYRDWYHYELLPALKKLQQRQQQWSHSTTPDIGGDSFRRLHKRQESCCSRSESRIIQGESPGDTESISCYKKFHLPHTISKVITNRCVLYGQGRQISAGLYPTNIIQSQYVTNFEQLKELIPFEDKKCFYEYLQMYIDQSTHLSEKLLYQLVLLNLKLKSQTEPNDISELLLNEYKKMQGDQFLKYNGQSAVSDDAMSREQFMSQPQDSFSTDNLTLSREQFISQDDFTPGMSRDQFTAQAAGDSQDEDKVLHRLRKLLLNGSKHKALRWAIENQEWVSALFIASSMDRESYMSVCALYIESIPRSDPLRTCLQVQFGLDIDYQYSDDWGIHLAAILNNAQNVSLIARFADILGGVKDICGQHFCYIAGRIQPGSSSSNTSSYVLVGAENQLLSEQIPIQSVMLTMAYDNTLPHLQYYKYYVALNYVKMGAYELGLCLFQNIASIFLNGSVSLDSENYKLITYVYDLSLTIYSRVNNQHALWINNLGDLINSTQLNFNSNQMNTISQGASVPNENVHASSLGYEQAPLSNSPYAPAVTFVQRNEVHEPSPAPTVNYQPYQEEQPNSLMPEVLPSVEESPPSMTLPPTQTEPAQPSMPAYYVPSYDSSMAGAGGNVQCVTQEPVISIHSKSTFPEDKTDSSPENAPKPAVENKPKESPATKEVKAPAEKSKNSGQKSWWKTFVPFPSPKNQMILPDDDKPQIIWDEDKKMWVNVNNKDESGPSELPPPPKMSELAGSQHTVPSEPSAPLTSSTAPVPLSMNPLLPNGPAPIKMGAQNGYRKNKAKYVNVWANNR